MWFPTVAWSALVAELAAAAVLRPEQFEGFGWTVRGLVYPVLTALPAVLWRGRGRPAGERPPYAAFGLLVLPFWSDVTATWLDLYARFDWWDKASHAGHWFLIGLGLALLARPVLRPRWLLVPLVGGAGALLAVLWEVLEWALFYRERGGDYGDTLGDLVLGTTGAVVAATLVAVLGWGRGRTVAGDA